jgi:phage anti-repressor protein
MNSIDIVYLVENNPITKLSKSYNNKLLNKLKSEFTDEQQQLFVTSFYCYLNYNQTTDYVIDLDNIWQWLGFQQKYHSKISLEKHFILNKDYKVLLPNVREQKNTRGGHNKETILLTIKTFKLFCIKAGTKKAGDIHEYFVKLEEILQSTLHEETDELRLQLEEQKQIFDKSLKNTKELERHNLMLREFSHSTEVVYIIRVKTFEDGTYIIKIGESRRGIESRYKEHKSKYEEAVILDCFSVKKSRDFEQFLHNHEKIRNNRYTKLPKHENEVELFLVGENLTYDIVSQIIEQNLKTFNEYSSADFEKLQAEKIALEEKLASAEVTRCNTCTRCSTSSTTAAAATAQPTNQQIPDFITDLIKSQEHRIKIQEENIKTQNEKLDKILELLQKSQSEKKITTGFGNIKKTVGPRLQKINPETLNLTKVYECLEEALLESNNTLKRPSIEKAIKESTIYHGFRWNYIAREKDPNLIENLAPTKKTKTPILGYIAKLDENKTAILNVYLDRKTAAIENGYTSSSGLDIPVKTGKQTRGHYYILFDECDEKLRGDFIENHLAGDAEKLLLFKDGVGQFDAAEGNLVREYICKYDCITTEKISDKTLAKMLDKDVAYNGFYYKRLGSRLKILDL